MFFRYQDLTSKLIIQFFFEEGEATERVFIIILKCISKIILLF